MRIVFLLMSLGFAVWGIWDIKTGKSSYGTRNGGIAEYTAAEMGLIFYFIAGVKILAGGSLLVAFAAEWIERLRGG